MTDSVLLTIMCIYFRVFVQDESGVRRTSGGDEFIVELEGTRSITGSVVDNLDGMCVFMHVCFIRIFDSLCGRYAMHACIIII